MNRNILFLCTGNSARSHIGEALLRHLAGHVFTVYSAGTDPKPDLHPGTRRIMAEAGISLEGHYPKDIAGLMEQVDFEKVIIVCSHAETHCPAALMPGQKLFWPFDDPAAAPGTLEEQLPVFRRVRGEIEARLREWLASQGIEARA